MKGGLADDVHFSEMGNTLNKIMSLSLQDRHLIHNTGWLLTCTAAI